jgi:hypothetical protein
MAPSICSPSHSSSSSARVTIYGLAAAPAAWLLRLLRLSEPDSPTVATAST